MTSVMIKAFFSVGPRGQGLAGHGPAGIDALAKLSS